MNDEKGYNGSEYEKLKCIWMSSLVIDYKLCDNQFDCENCMFDKVMRNLVTERKTEPAPTINVLNLISDKLSRIEYDNKIIYLKNNFIAKEICPNTFYLGINPFFVCFLDSLSSFILYGFRENIFTGQDLIQIFGPWGTITLPAPVGLLLYDQIGNPADDPWKSQWFAIAGVDGREIIKAGLSRPEWGKMRRRAADIIEEIKLQVPKIGDTMMDGGTRVRSLYQLVGNKRYLTILNSLSD